MEPVRKANRGDAATLASLVESYWAFEGISGYAADAVEEALRGLLESESLGCGWLAQVDGQAVAYLLVVYVFSLENGGLTAEIDELFVREAFRGRGLGRALLTAAEATCRDAGCTHLSLQIGKVNRSARAFYLRAGFSERQGYELLEKTLA